MRSGTPLARLRERQRRAAAPERLAYARERGLEYAVEQTEIVAEAAAVDAASAQADADAALVLATDASADAAQAQLDVDGLADGTTPHTGLNVGGVDVKPFLDQTDGTKITAPGAFGPAVVETDAVLQGAVTPSYSAITTTAVLWSAESTEKTVQTVVADVVRGEVLIRASVQVLFDSVASSATTGTLHLYRDGSEIFAAAVVIGSVISSGSNWIFPPQWSLEYVDTPTPATGISYEIKFEPGAVNNGQVSRRVLHVLPLEG